ncbi:MAG TPA: amino acid-binding protein [Bacillota bacterium]|nr:amino acid-binding protein [Bacillota bacterium]
MKVKQLSLFLENKPGALSRPVQLLAKAKVNILTLSVADTQQFGILRLIIRDWEKAMALLEQEGFVVKVTDMVAIEVSDAPGGLAEILAALERTRVNLEYMYGFTQRKAGKGLLVFRFDDPDRAIEALQKKGINPVRSVELFKDLGN